MAPRLLSFYRELAEAQFVAEKTLVPPRHPMSSEAAALKTEKGQPLLSFDDLGVDQASLHQSLALVLAVFRAYPDVVGDIPSSAGRDDDALPGLSVETAEAWFDGNAIPENRDESPSSDGLVLEALTHAALKPFLARRSKELRDVVSAQVWRRGYCPVCGGTPDFSFLDRNNGSRRLLCSRCDAEWVFQRLQCPFCSNEDQDKLGYLSDDGARYRVYVCDQCRRYIKAVDLRISPADTMPVVERLLTHDLDLAAMEKGYRPGAFAGDDADMGS